jgi:signal peptidase I
VSPDSYVVRPQTKNKWFVYEIFIIVWVAIIMYVIPAWGEYKSYRIPAAGMNDTLRVGDIVLADLSAYDNNPPKPNDIVIFLWPDDKQTTYIKRCVAIGGQEIEIINKQLFVDGAECSNPPEVLFTKPVVPRDSRGIDTPDNWGPFVVPSDHYFMLGDNRDSSYDSRFWGSVHKDLLIGKAMKIIWSSNFDRIGLQIK